MGRLFLVEYNTDPFMEYFHCLICRLRVAFMENRIINVDSRRGIFNKVFNVEVPDEERYHEELNGNTVADAYCVQCGELLGCKLIAVPEPSSYYREGRFVMRLEKLMNGDDQDESDNEQDHDQDESDNEQDHDQDESDNEQDHGQDVGDNEQDHGQDVGDNEQNHDDDQEADADQGDDGIDNVDMMNVDI